MRIITSDWDIIYEAISIKLEGNRLYAYPLFTNMLDKPVCLKVVPSKQDGEKLMEDMRRDYIIGKPMFYMSEIMKQKETLV